MPNHTFNFVVADKQWFNHMLSKNDKGKLVLDVGRFLPNTALANIYKDFTSDAPEAYHNPTLDIVLSDEDKEKAKELKDFPLRAFYEKKEGKYNKEHFGFENVSDFNQWVWGSKWGAYDLKEREAQNERQVYCFNTAWGYLTKPLEVMSNYSETPVINYSVCEGSWFCTRRVFQGGRIVSFKEVRPSLVPEWVISELVNDVLFKEAIEWMGYNDLEEFLNDQTTREEKEVKYTSDVEMYRSWFGTTLSYVVNKKETAFALDFLERLFNLYSPIYTKITLSFPIVEAGDIKIDRNKLEEELESLERIDFYVKHFNKLHEAPKVIPPEFIKHLRNADKVKVLLVKNTVFMYLTTVNAYLLPNKGKDDV